MITNIPDEHHIVKHCKHSQYYVHNERIRPYAEAFHLRPATQATTEEKELSGVYYEWFDGSPGEKLKASCHFIGLSMKRKDALLRLRAGLIREHGIARSLKLRVLHEPTSECPPYSSIRGLPKPPDDELCSLLATLAVVEAVDLTVLAAL
jgi:hypothetical protein